MLTCLIMALGGDASNPRIVCYARNAAVEQLTSSFNASGFSMRSSTRRLAACPVLIEFFTRGCISPYPCTVMRSVATPMVCSR